MAQNPTPIARRLDAIPLVMSEADRNERFPEPDLHERVQRHDTGCIEAWDGAAWVELLCPGGAGDVTDEELQAVVDDLTALDARVAELELVELGCPVYCGTGSPEGVVTAAVGSLYYQRDAAATTHPQWVKRTGTGTTGWRAYAGHRGDGAQSLAIGDSSTAAGADAVALGSAADAAGDTALVIGKGASADAATVRCIAIGEEASAANDASHCIVIGYQAAAVSPLRAVAIGRRATVASDYAEAIGDEARVGPTSDSSFVGGLNAYAGGEVAYGGEPAAYADATNAVAIGCVPAVYAPDGIAISFAAVYGHSGIAIGYGARAGDPTSAATRTGSAYALALGAGALARGAQSIAIGHGAEVPAGQDAAIALGALAQPTAPGMLMIGSLTHPITAVHFNGSASPAITVDAVTGAATFHGTLVP